MAIVLLLPSFKRLMKPTQVDDVGISFPQSSAMENAEVNWDKNPGEYQASHGERRGNSFSAAIFAERKIGPAEKIRQMQQSSARKSSTYVLPTPTDLKVPISSRISSSGPHARPNNTSGHTYNLSHSSPLDPKKEDQDYSVPHLSEYAILKLQSLLKERSRVNKKNTHSTRGHSTSYV